MHRPLVFVSHSSQNDDVISRLHDALEARLPCDLWVDHRDIGPGQDWDREIQEKLNACVAGVIGLSRQSIGSRPCRNEWWTLADLGKALYVVLLEPIAKEEYPWWLRTTQRVDLSADFDGGVEALAASLTAGAGEDAAPAALSSLVTARIEGWVAIRHLTQIPIRGRDRDLAEIARLLKEGITSLLHVGGAGKSRLAAEIMLTAEDVNGAIWHVCNEYSTPEDVLILLRQHFGLDVDTPRDDVLTRLRGHRRLVVLDNGESVAPEQRPEYAQLANMLAAMGARVLITSRVEWPGLSWGKAYTPETLAPEAAEQIVLDMARAANCPYDLAGLTRTVAEKARWHPRLIEWAVRRMTRTEPARVISDLAALKSPGAQEALTEMIGKTLEQMTAEEGPEYAAALSALAACRGGFTFEAAGHLLEADEDRLEQVLDTLQAWQFVRLHVRGGTAARYDIEAMVLAALDVDEQARRRHYLYYTALAGELDQLADATKYAQMDVETENFEAAFAWALSSGGVDDAHRLAVACSAFLANRGRFKQRMDWMLAVEGKLRGAPPEQADEALRGAVQLSLGVSYWTYAAIEERGPNLRRAIEAYEEALRYYRPETAPLDYAATQNNLGLACSDYAAIEERGPNLRRAIAAYQEAADTYEEQGFSDRAAQCLTGLANALYSLGQYSDALQVLEKVMAIYRRDDQARDDLAWALSSLGGVLEALGRLDEAVGAYTQALDLLPDTPPLLRNRAEACILARHLDAAEADLARAAALDGHEDSAYLWLRRAQIAIVRGDGALADAMLDEAIQRDTAFEVNYERALAAWLRGDMEAARSQLQAALADATPEYRARRRREMQQLLDEQPALRERAELLALLDEPES